MVNINGDKVKSLREQQGLTQLYLATAVGVTTDTISRWENKRYPTIKRDNGLKLAEALEVELSAILEDQELEMKAPEPEAPQAISLETEQPTQVQEKEVEAAQSTTDIPTKRSDKKFILSILIGLVIIAITALGFILFQKKASPITGTRHTPSHIISGTPFPVVIEVNVAENINTAYVVKETFPSHCEILSTYPEIKLDQLKDRTLKWFKKNQQGNRFIYVARMPQSQSEKNIKFRGTVSGNGEQSSTLIGGINQISLANFHWADKDQDNRINDQEILEAYEKFNGIPAINFEEIEEIWMGTGYRWDEKQSKIIIL